MEKFRNYTTQKSTILKHLKKSGSITTMTAFSKYGITRLSEYIRILRSEKHNIPPVEWKTNPTTGNRYGVYKLVK